jgi:hypothetical protein
MYLLKTQLYGGIISNIEIRWFKPYLVKDLGGEIKSVNGLVYEDEDTDNIEPFCESSFCFKGDSIYLNPTSYNRWVYVLVASKSEIGRGCQLLIDACENPNNVYKFDL